MTTWTNCGPRGRRNVADERIATESRDLERKRSWRDEHLKWICGFANAHGGVLEVGRDDRGKVVGVKDVVRLLEEIPNKIQSLLGIVVDVNLKSKDGAEYLQIVVGSCPNPISYKGEFHYRSGSTKQVLHGAALSRFLMRKQETAQAAQETTQEPAETTQETAQEPARTTQEPAPTTRERVLALLEAEPRITRRILAKRIGITPSGIKYHLAKLRKAGIIRHVGPTKAGRWEVLK